jgi:hypothetical protein
VSAAWHKPARGLRAAGLMRAMFVTYVVLIVAGLAYLSVIGLLHH